MEYYSVNVVRNRMKLIRMMKRKSLFLLLFICVTGGNAWSQQEKLITNFMYDKMSLNPGETGIDEGICATSIYRNQWDKVNGAPNSAVFNVEGNLSRYIPINAGISFFHDAIGFTRQNNILLNISYPLAIPGAGTLGIGVGLGIMTFGMNPQWEPPTGTPDATLPVGFGDTKFDANFGLYFKGDQGYYVGLSSTRLTASTFESDDPTSITYNAARHYNLLGGYKYPITATGDLEGNLLVRTDMIKVSADINAKYTYKNMMYGGLTYRTSDAIAILLGAQPFKIMNKINSPLDGFIVGYSYDITINQLSSVSRGSHEILLKYCYYLPPVPIQKSKHPRWL